MQKIDEDSVRRQLQKLNIPYDMKIVKQVHLFLNKFIGPLSLQDAQYNIPAACAIICQTIKIPTVDCKSMTSTGVKIENVMRHIGNLSKQKFLETIQTQIKKSNFSSHSLVEKVGNIKIAFRVFKKYKTIFENLSLQNKIQFHVNHDLLAFFWIIYLIAKHRLNALQDLNQSTKILILIIQEAFTKYCGRADKKIIIDYISQRDKFPDLPKISPAQQKTIKQELTLLIQQIIQNRNVSAAHSFSNLLDNSILLSRLVDDLNYLYNTLYMTLPEGRFIDQSTFLQLTKNLTPQAFAPKSKLQPISKVIDFGNDDDDDDDSMNDQCKTEEKKPNFFSISDSQSSLSKHLVFSNKKSQQSKTKTAQKQKRESNQVQIPPTPVYLGRRMVTWVQEFIEDYDRSVQPNMRRYFENKQLIFEDILANLNKKISVQIETLTNHVINKQKNILEIIKMCLTFANKLLEIKTKIDLSIQKNFNPLLCISVYLYNETSRNLKIELQKYCNSYQTDIVDCLHILYQIQKINNLPDFITKSLAELEKQVIIKQIWSTNRGVALLAEGRNASNQTIFNRMQGIIYERIKQICLANQVSLLEVKNIQPLVDQILKNKPELLKRTMLDQIIICSICACLNLNQTKYNLALSTIFQKYNEIPTSLHVYSQIVPLHQEGQAPKTLFDFYNSVFIQYVQQMLKVEQSPKYMVTPIRKSHLQQVRSSQEGTLRTQNLFRTGAIGSGTNYQKNLLKKMQSPEQDQDYAELKPSLKRKDTFGPGGF